MIWNTNSENILSLLYAQLAEQESTRTVLAALGGIVALRRRADWRGEDAKADCSLAS